MRATAAYGELRRLGRPVITTREAATLWRTEQRTASQRLRTLSEAGLVRRLRRGLWSLDADVDPLSLPHHLTAPFPAYASLWSALSRHGMIEQIPRRVYAVSLGRSRQIETAVGAFSIHQIVPELFGGFQGTEGEGYMAEPEKALFDTLYLRAAAGSQAYFPELSLPPDFDPGRLAEWEERIASPRLRTLVSRRREQVLAANAE